MHTILSAYHQTVEQESHQSVKQFGSRSGLTWVQTVCKGNQQMTQAELSYSPAELVAVLVPMAISENIAMYAWVKVYRIIPEFRILRLTFHRKSDSNC